MEQMASATGIPLTILKHAKKSGCMFVSHGRCDLIVFLTWFFSRDVPDDEQVDWAKRDKRASALIKECKLEEERNLVINYALSEKFIRYLTQVLFFGELERIANEFPAGLKGKSEVDIYAECVKQNKMVKQHIETQVNIWVEKKGKV